MQGWRMMSCAVLCVVLLCMQQKLLVALALLPYAAVCRPVLCCAVVSHGAPCYAVLW